MRRTINFLYLSAWCSRLVFYDNDLKFIMFSVSLVVVAGDLAVFWWPPFDFWNL